MKINFNVSGTMYIPDDAIPHYDVDGNLYALEFNDIMYMLQMCIVAEGGAWGNETITDPQVLENHSINNILYKEAKFEATI
jgi:hypothetical protein